MSDSFPSDGPFFDDLERGQILPSLPSATTDPADNVLYRAITGDQYALSADSGLADRVTGRSRVGLINPTLLINYSIGQSTMATRRAIANLFYRDLVLLRPVAVGERINTVTRVLALADARPKPGTKPRGKVLLGIETFAAGQPVLQYQRCALLPSRGESGSPQNDTIDNSDPASIDDLTRVAPAGWDLAPLGEPVDWPIGERRGDVTRDHVDLAAAFARMTFNQAAVHRDVGESAHCRRLVFGGHVVALAQASLTRLMPQLATVLGWIECSHTAPVFEGDLLSFEHELQEQLRTESGVISQFKTIAERIDAGQNQVVLDWTSIVLHP